MADWKVYCLLHRELFDAGKLQALGDLVRPSKAGDLPPAAEGRVRARIAKKEGEMSPEEGACVDRILELLGGFARRHDRCDLRIAADDSGEYLRVVAAEGKAWLGFSIWEDAAYWQLYWGGGFKRTLETHEAHADRCRDEIARLKRSVAEERSDVLRRKKLEQALERWKSGLRSSEEMIEGVTRTAEANRKRAFGVDVLEEMAKTPFQSTA